MSVGNPYGRVRSGFTLVELITVVTILCILVALVVGAMVGVKNSEAYQSTRLMFEALDSALARYYEDWNLYPYCTAPPSTSYGNIGANLPTTGVTEDNQEAALYAALTTTKRKGPYITGGTQALMKSIGAGGGTYYKYFMFTDGWGRKIKYARLMSGQAAVNVPPVLWSDGPNEADPLDDIFNYDYTKP
jgi:prepilin-type N-terminal cleavage/methylation domain-containing protein